MQMKLVFISAALINNVVLSRSLGVTPFIGASKHIESSVGLGLTVTIVMTLSAAIVFAVNNFVLYPLGVTYLSLIVFVLVVVIIVQLAGLYLNKAGSDLRKQMGISLPLVTTNCAVLGVLLINAEQFGDSFALTIANALGAAAGFALVMVLFAGVRERIEYNQVSANFSGIPIAMIAAGLMSIVFFGFSGF